MIDYEKELNHEQYQVVMEEKGPLLVLAGAGSGKTRTLTYRVARLLECGVNPESILLATFTNKAARSMLSRVESLAGLHTRTITGGTFHHIAHVILRKYATRIGYQRNFSILDREDSRQLINTCISELRIEQKLKKFPKSNIIGDIIGLILNTQNSLEDVLAGRYPYLLDYTDDINQTALLYIRKKKEMSVMDFDDLLYNCRLLLADNPDVTNILSGVFKHILVDEYQDVNIIQAEIIDMLACSQENLMVVGDDSQSIYSFRGASYKNIINFHKKYPDCKIYKLEINYRSTPEILHLANLSINKNENRYPKKLKALRESGTRPVAVYAENVLKQADFVAQRIEELYRSGVELSQIAVLYRAHYHSMEMQMELVRRNIPFDIRSGIRFYEQAHIKDITSYMRILVNPKDELPWSRLLTMYPKIGKATFKKIWSYMSQKDNPLEVFLSQEFMNIITAAARAGIEQCRQNMQEILKLPTEERIAEKVIHVLLNKGDYRSYLQRNYSDYASREEDLIHLAAFSYRFNNMEDFLNELALLTNMDAGEGFEDEQDEKVVLSTIHQAKGLEWSYVFLIWCADGMIPLHRTLKERDGEEEERRLFYVALTRAQDQLYLCCPALDYRRGEGNIVLSASRFIKEIETFSAEDDKRPYEQWTLYNDYQ